MIPQEIIRKKRDKHSLSEEEINSRLNNLPDFEPKIKNGFLGRYARMVTSANTGAVLK